MASTLFRTRFGDGRIDRDPSGSITKIHLPTSDAPQMAATAESDPLANDLEQYFAGNACLLPSRDLIEKASNTDPQRRIYESVSQLRPGVRATYAEVAADVGHAGAARAVGAAMARNPFAPIIPCHRVVGSDGSLRGYAGGVSMKARLLEMESGWSADG